MNPSRSTAAPGVGTPLGDLPPIPPPVMRARDKVAPVSVWEALGATMSADSRLISGEVVLPIGRLEFPLWEGPRLSMRQDCNKRGGRVLGDVGELSCAEVEIVKRLRRAGWDAYWYQAFRCGRERWRPYIWDAAPHPEGVRALQASAGAGGGHPDIIGWSGDRIVALESKGPGDSLRPGQVAWFQRASAFGLTADELGIVEWTAAR